MKVSVCITTYNHEPYIAQALDSVLAQETDFEFEIIIGEDDSSDNTRAIVKEYKRKFPDRIKLFLNDRKNVIYINGIATSRWNFSNNLKHANGKYIALLDGDDYWADKKKLEKQANCLEMNSLISGCFHNSLVLDENGCSREFNTLSESQTFTTRDLIARNFIATSSVMFRNQLNPLPNWFFRLTAGDWGIHLLNSINGPLMYLDFIGSVYRLHQGGVWNSLNNREMCDRGIAVMEIFDEVLNYEYHEEVTKAIMLRRKNFGVERAFGFLDTIKRIKNTFPWYKVKSQ